MRYYIASKLENVEQVRVLKSYLEARGHVHTYDWTVHGSVQKQGHDVIAGVAEKEACGVMSADVVFVLLPGGRGTHVETGIAIGVAAALGTRIVIMSENPDTDFGTGGETCAFYHHPFVETVDSFYELLKLVDNL
jgi:hypothetical protein